MLKPVSPPPVATSWAKVRKAQKGVDERKSYTAAVKLQKAQRDRRKATQLEVVNGGKR